MATLYGKEAEKEIVCSVPSYLGMHDGAEVKANHATCEAGTDTKERFNVKCVDNGYIFHCYHCGISGYYRRKDTIRSMHEYGTAEVKRGVIGTDLKDRYVNAIMEYDSFSPESKLWLATYGFDADMCHKFGIRSDSKTFKTYLPVHDGIEHITGYQTRNHTTHGPKYLTWLTNNYCSVYVGNNTATVFVVEDLLSAYKLHYAGASVVCALGTKVPSVSTIQPHITMTSATKLVLWLDNDLAGLLGANSIARELAPVCTISNITSPLRREPKETSLLELKELIDNV